MFTFKLQEGKKMKGRMLKTVTERPRLFFLKSIIHKMLLVMWSNFRLKNGVYKIQTGEEK